MRHIIQISRLRIKRVRFRTSEQNLKWRREQDLYPLSTYRCFSSSSVGSGTDESVSSEDKKKDPFRLAHTLFSYVWPKGGSDEKSNQEAKIMKQRVLASLGLMIGGKALTVQVPFLFKGIVDSLPTTNIQAVELAGNSDLLTHSAIPLSLLIGYGMARASAVGMQELRNAVFAHVAQRAIKNLGRSVFDHIHRLDMTYHLSRNSGTLSRVLDRGNRSISFILNAMVFHIVPTVIELGVVTGLVAYNFGSMHSLVVLGTVTAYTGFTIGITTWRTEFRRSMNKLENEASGKVIDSLLNYETVKYFNNELHEGERYEKSLAGYQEAALKTQSSLSLLNFGQNAIFSVGLTAIMCLTTNQILMGTASVGDLVLVNGLLFQLSMPLNFIGSVYRTVQQSLIDMEHMLALQQTQPSLLDSSTSQKYEPQEYGTAISVRDLHFAYPAAHQRPILNGLTLDIEEGQTVAIVGASGCGKSSLLRLLYRFYQPHEGSITIGGREAQNFTTDSIRAAIAVVPQDTVLFNETIGYNIHYGNLDASWDQVIEAARQARLHDSIMKFGDQYDTIVGERGLKLSGGEKQRVAIARAILKGAPILLCDEPTSSLDSSTEQEIMSNLKEIGKNNTTIIVAHRLSTIQDCDKIFVLHEGRVAESGPHEALVAKNGIYTKLLQMQHS